MSSGELNGGDVVYDGCACYLRDIITGRGCIECIDSKNEFVHVRKKLTPIPTSLLIGLPFGSTLELRDKKWTRVPRMKAEDIVTAVKREAGYETASEHEEVCTLEECGMQESQISDKEVNGPSSNCQPLRKKPKLEYGHLVDDNSAQALKQEDVLAMKQSGIDGIKLISTLVSKSNTFGKRTSFAQEKYIRRKMRTHMTQVAILKLDAVNIAQAYGDASKLGGLRPNDVYMLMNEGNVTAGKKVIVFDHATGYLTANVLNRLGGHGICLFLSDRKGVSHHIVGQCLLPMNVRQGFHLLPMQLLQAAVECKFSNDNFLQHEWFQDYSFLQEVAEDSTKPAVDRKRADESLKRRMERREQRLVIWEQLKEQQIDAFLVVIDPGRVDANQPHLLANLLSELYKIALFTVKPGGKFISFCSQMNPVADLLSYMKARRHTWSNMGLEETFVRRLCTLPGRCHPQMEGQLRLFEGFLLKATRLADTEISPTELDGTCGLTQET